MIRMKRINIFSFIPGRWMFTGILIFGLQFTSILQAQNCISFTGTDDYVLIPDNPSQQFGSGNFTISFWMTLSNVNRQSDGLFGKGNYQWLALMYNYNGITG